MAASGGWKLGEAARRAAASFGRATGAGAVARAAVDAHDALIHRIAAWALEHGVPEREVKRALAAYARTQRVQSAVAVLLPFVPSPAALRALAGSKAPPGSPEVLVKSRRIK